MGGGLNSKYNTIIKSLIFFSGSNTMVSDEYKLYITHSREVNPDTTEYSAKPQRCNVEFHCGKLMI